MRTPILAVLALAVFVFAAMYSFNVAPSFIWQSLAYLGLGLLVLMAFAIGIIALKTALVFIYQRYKS